MSRIKNPFSILMKKKLFILFLVFSLFFLSGCGEEEKPQRSPKHELQDKKDHLYRKLAKLKEDVMLGELKGWRGKLDALWIHGNLIDPTMVEYMDDIKRVALQLEKEREAGSSKSDLIVEPRIDSTINVTEEILTTYLQEILSGIEAKTLTKWELLLDKVYLHGDKLLDKHSELIKIIETKGTELNRSLR